VTDEAETLNRLKEKSIAVRAEAARGLGEKGGTDAIEPLVDTAIGDVSPGVRLAAAGAASDILSRYRLPDKRAGLSEERRLALLKRFRAMDPGVNTGLFQVVASLGLPAGMTILVRGLRDPRGDVRTGALVGLERMCASAAFNGSRPVERALFAALADHRQQPEMLVELARLMLRLGYRGLIEPLHALEGRLAAERGAALGELLQLASESPATPSVAGCWTSRGPDVGEVRVRLGPRRWLLPMGGICATGSDKRLQTDRLLISSSGVFRRAGKKADLPVRRLQARLEGMEGTEVLQVGLDSYRLAQEREILRLLDALLALPGVDAAARAEGRRAIEPALSKRMAGDYVRGVMALWNGELREAVSLLSQVGSGASIPAEALWHLSDALFQLDQPAEAREYLKKYLEKADARSVYRERGRQLLSQD